MKETRKLLVAAAVCGALATVALWSPRARADLPHKTFRLHLETGLFTLQRGEIDWDDSPREWDLDRMGVGLGIPRACAGLGYVVWQGLVIGGRIETAYYDDDYEWWGYDDAFSLKLLPYVEYAFLTGMFRPFVTIYLGVKGLVSDLGDNNDFSMWGFATGGGGGCHIFLLPRFSIDLTLLFGIEVGGVDIDYDGPADDEGDYLLFDMGVMFGISGWI
jgi:hypothetical protein